MCNCSSLYSRPLRHETHTTIHTIDDLVRLTYHDIQHSGKNNVFFWINKYSTDFRITHSIIYIELLNVDTLKFPSGTP